jgi:Flp pilus assembly protein CpaB
VPTLLPRPSQRPAFWLRRRPLPFWLLAVVLGVATALLVGSLVSSAEAERARWGELRPTLVATADVAGGDHLTASDVAVRRLPAALVPPGALRSLPPGAVVAVDVHRGEAVLAARLVGPGSSAVAARIPAGTRGVAVPTGSGLPLVVGDRVDVLATFDATISEGEPTFAVARRAVVVHVGEDAVTVAVGESSAPKVAYALAAGTVTLVLSGTTTRR